MIISIDLAVLAGAFLKGFGDEAGPRRAARSEGVRDKRLRRCGDGPTALTGRSESGGRVAL
jgi:hypothetical protein